jgi:tetratricopeptide (TPR) repeat protein
MRKPIFCLAIVMPLTSAVPFAAEATTAVDELFDPAAIARSICTGGAGSLRQAYAPSTQFSMARLAFWRKGGDAVLMDDLGTYSYKVTTSSPVAQRFFDQGLRLAYGFNHGEAVRAFRKAQKLDPNCAMCYWGEALALGPNINAAMLPGDNEAALAALAKAGQAAPSASASEQALIRALAKRYSADASADRKALDAAYAEAMGAVSRQYPDDIDIATLYAEAVMGVQPWDYWQPGGKKPKGTSGEALSAIERVLAKNPEHPGAIHYYIHLVEASAKPERAVPFAERLGALMPGAGHIVHMPSHIWYRIGRYKDSLDANVKAVRADEAYFKLADPTMIYRAGYYPHNIHFVVVSAQMQGDEKTALEFSDKLLSAYSDDMLNAAPWVQPIRSAPYFVMADFGGPEAMLAAAEPDARFPYVKAMWHFAKGSALVRLKRLDEARAEAQAIMSIGKSADFAFYLAGGVPAPDILAIATDVLNARIARAAGDDESAIAHLTAAVEKQDLLPYMEPPYWYYPVRRSLGAALFSAGRVDDAIQAFRQVLIEAPNDAYALYGLARAYELDRDGAAAKKTDALFAKAWAGGETHPDLAAY